MGELKIVYMHPEELKPFVGNPRKITDVSIEKLTRSIESFGFVNPIIAQKGTNMIIAGHQRLKAAEKLGLDEVPVILLDVDDVTAKAYNIADNRLNEESDWVFDQLSNLVVELLANDFDIFLTGIDEVELEKLLEPKGMELEGEKKMLPPIMRITFEKPEDFERMEDDLRQLIASKYPDVSVLISCGEI